MSNGEEKELLTDLECASRYSVNRVTIWRWVKRGVFPAPIKLSNGFSRWDIEDLVAYENECKSEGR
jgi:prophage regulatory protein